MEISVISTSTINIVGICLNMLGVLLLFFWSLPQASESAGTGRVVEDGTPMDDGRTAGEHRAAAARARMRAKVISYVALVLLFIGFGCQLCAAL